MNLSDNIKYIRERIRLAQQRTGRTNNVEIVAVTKTHSVSTIVQAVACGIRSIGENRVQEAAAKFPLIPADDPALKKRMVGHLQSNKARKAMELFESIDSVDSVKLGQKIAAMNGDKEVPVEILLEINTSGEPAKFGFDPNEIDNILKVVQISNLNVKGLMTIGPLGGDEKHIRTAFISLRTLLDNLNQQLTETALTELSMGMSDDYEIAVEEGSTMVRIGTSLFGPRKY